MDYRSWLKAGLAKPGKKATDLASRLGKHRSAVDKMVSGSREIKAEELPIIAEYIQEPIPTNGNGSSGSSVQALDAPLVSVQIEGAVEAGAFREAEMLAQVKPRTIVVPRDSRYPFAEPRAFEVHGDSMDLLGILDGHLVVGVDFSQTGASLSNGMVVVVERQRDGLVERSLKQVQVHREEFEFCPRSSNPAHESFIIPRRWTGDEFDPKFRILAVIRQSIQNFD